MRIHQENIEAMETDPDLKGRIIRSIEGQEVILEGKVLEPERVRSFDSTDVSVIDAGTFDAARASEGRCCALNFAAFRYPCANYYYGNTQEEQLVRSSTLLPCLTSQETMDGFYTPHHDVTDPCLNSDAIYTPGVTVIRDLGPGCRMLSSEERYKVDMITCSAPDLSSCQVPDSRLMEVQIQRIARICEIAWVHGADDLILGAFGCGAFMNDPYIVAKASAEAVKRFDGCFRGIIFAVPCSKNFRNHDAFQSILGTEFPIGFGRIAD